MKDLKRNKGKSLLTPFDSYVVIDIETSGFDANHDSIIEIGALRIKNNEITDKFSSLVKPDKYFIDSQAKAETDYFETESGKYCYYIDDFIIERTGINNAMLLDAPETKDVLAAFFKFINDDIIVGHNVNFDVNFIYDNYLKYFGKTFGNDFTDTLRLSRIALKELEHHTLKDVAKYFSVVQTMEHRALADCETTWKCYEELKKYIKENNIEMPVHKHKSSGHKFRAKDIATDNIEFDETSPFYRKVFCFTGTLDKMTRKEAMQIVADNGGINGDGVTKKTNYLVLGNNDYCKAIKDGKSSKHKKAQQLILKGQELQIISENVFYDMISDAIETALG